LPRARRPSVVSRSHDYEPPPAPAHPSIILRLGRRRGPSLRSILFLCILTLRMRTLTDILTNANPSGRASRWGGRNLDGCRASSRSVYSCGSCSSLPRMHRLPRLAFPPVSSSSSFQLALALDSTHPCFHSTLPGSPPSQPPTLHSGIRRVDACSPPSPTSFLAETGLFALHYDRRMDQNVRGARARGVLRSSPCSFSPPSWRRAGCNAEGGRWTRVCDPRWIRLSRMGARNGER
jgi:hypothetical protein